jgi:hypothetical protein
LLKHEVELVRIDTNGDPARQGEATSLKAQIIAERTRMHFAAQNDVRTV